MARVEYGVVKMDEDFYEEVLVEHLRDELGYEHSYGSEVERTSADYCDVFLADVLREALARINPALPTPAIEEAILKLENVEGGDLPQRNEVFADYLQNGVEVCFFDGREERSDIAYLLDFTHPNNNDFHVVNQWTVV